MRAVTWHGKRDMRVETVPDPTIEDPRDAIVRITSTGLCGSDLHLYEVLGPFMHEGDVVGHEPMGIVEAVGTEAAGELSVGDRVVIPFNVSCGRCWMCDRGLYAQCETTQVRSHDKGAALYGYTELYGQVPGGQAEYLRVPYADFACIRVPEGPVDERFLYLSDILPTAWQGYDFADVPKGGTVAVFGLGPVGQFVTRVARARGAETVVGIDLVPERLEMARRHDVTTIDLREVDDVAAAIRDLTDGRGPDGVVDAVGMEAHGSTMAAFAQHAAGLLPEPAAQAMVEKLGVDRLDAFTAAISTVRRGGTVSVSGVYGGAVDPIPMLEVFDKGLTMRFGQCHVKRWIDDILPLVVDDADPLGTLDMATHKLPLERAPEAYAMFQAKDDGCIKVVFEP
ncbi:MAG: glutathione-dependent formaldehyde dehydrogenase [Actinobacteria bacterium]|nr:glutathione-dependent formaldehyde dehydrogenase [Actinomycetota bacterium]